jgi:hypothetical protein
MLISENNWLILVHCSFIGDVGDPSKHPFGPLTFLNPPTESIFLFVTKKAAP